MVVRFCPGSSQPLHATYLCYQIGVRFLLWHWLRTKAEFKHQAAIESQSRYTCSGQARSAQGKGERGKGKGKPPR